MGEKTILITGGAGFIGYHLSRYLLKNDGGIKITGFDNLNDYYDVNLKKDRLKELTQYKEYTFIKGDLADEEAARRLFKEQKPDLVVHLGGQAGVRYSISNPKEYFDSNLAGFFHILEACRHSPEEPYGAHPVSHLLFASSSSVYGRNRKVPYSTQDKTDEPASFYAATKKSNELMAHAYSHLYKIPCTGLRFFTVYGPMGRPDMAYFSFTDKLRRKEAIPVYNGGDMYRDFTYIDDIVKGIAAVMKRPPSGTEETAPYKIYNIGNNHPESLLHFIEILEKCMKKEGLIEEEGKKEFLPMQAGDVYQTYADMEELKRDFGFHPSTDLETGLTEFVRWYKEYYKL